MLAVYVSEGSFGSFKSRGRADRGLASEHGRLVVLWVPRVILPG